MFDTDCPCVLPNINAQKLVVFLHGYGSNGADLLEIAKIWQPELPTTAFYSPNGIEQSETNPFGQAYQWFGLKDLSPYNVRPGLDKARPAIHQFLKKLLFEHKLLASDIILVGFSQGTMVALDMMFALPRLGGIIGYSGTFYPPLNHIVPLPSAPPVLLVHGTADMVVPYTMMPIAQTQLRQFGVNVMTKSCPNLGHSIDEAGIMAGLDFIKYQQQNQPIAL